VAAIRLLFTGFKTPRTGNFNQQIKTMGVYTNIEFRNANDPEFIAAKNGTDEEREEWEDENGIIADRPGGHCDAIDGEQCIEETEDEYGGWIIDLSKIPKDATHIVIHRG